MPETVLYQFGRGEGQDSASAFCSKAHRLLTAKGLDYRPHTVTNPLELRRLNPGSGKVPVLSHDGTLVSDSTRIARFLEERHPTPPLWPTDPAARAQATLLEDWADESLYWYVVYLRWQVDANFRPFAQRTFRFAPAPIRPLVTRFARRQALRQLHGQGLGRLAPAVVLEQLAGHLDLLAELTGHADRPWLVGDALSVADIAVFAMVQGLHSPGLPESRALVAARPGLVSWARRVDEATRGAHTVAWA
jgi:glutathione S-transferase